MKRRLLTLCLCLLVLLPAPASADTPKNKGLLISPLRQYISLDAGKQAIGRFTVANLTEQPITVTLSAKQFSVSDYAYNYNFSPPNDWLSFKLTQIPLEPNESREVDYTVTVPAGTAAGGQYYTLLASAELNAGNLKSTVQAATLLYLTVNGKLVRTSQLVGSSIHRIVFGKQVQYTIDVRNTGNVHYFAYFSGQLHGLTAKSASGTSHILLPGPIRQVVGDINAPLLPGIYKATYGYKTDAGTTVTQSRFIIFLPPWSLAFLVLLLIIGLNLYGRRKRNKTKEQPPSED